jgi:putative glycerol kinase 5
MEPMIDSRNVLGLDVGTTTIKAIILNKNGAILGKSDSKTEVTNPEPGQEEIDHLRLWEKVTTVLKACIESANLHPDNITCMGICTLRASFITWSKQTGKPFHNVITWKDTRAENLANEWDKGIQLRLLRLVSGVAYMVTRNKAHELNKNYHLDTSLCNIKLAWALKNIPEVRQAAQEDDLMFGTLDTWLVYKLNGGAVHVTEASNVITTGLWDMFTQAYSERNLKYFDIPASILPKVVSSGNSNDYGAVDYTLLKDNIPTDEIAKKLPITAVMADQGASAFGLGCTKKGDMKVTLGTGTFFNMNTGSTPHCSFRGLWPFICWKQQEKDVNFFVEGHIYGTSASMEWGKNMGFFHNPSETSDIAYSANDLDDLCFVPAFHGLQEPFTDPKAGCGFIGLKIHHGDKELTRAILESIAFGVKAIVDRVEDQIQYAKETKTIKVDGGTSTNDFVMQLIANLTQKSVTRMSSPDMSVVGVAFMAGIQSKMWEMEDNIYEILGTFKTFKPTTSIDEKKKLTSRFNCWKNACKHFTKFQSNRC